MNATELDAEIASLAKVNTDRLMAIDAPAGDCRYVYFIQAVDGRQLVKIGVAQSPHQRLAAIQKMSPSQLEIIGVVGGVGQTEERRLHGVFADLRVHGEWFMPAPRLLAYVDSVAQRDGRTGFRVDDFGYRLWRPVPAAEAVAA